MTFWCEPRQWQDKGWPFIPVRDVQTGRTDKLKGFNSEHKLLKLESGLIVKDTLQTWVYFNFDLMAWSVIFKS